MLCEYSLVHIQCHTLKSLELKFSLKIVVSIAKANQNAHNFIDS